MSKIKGLDNLSSSKTILLSMYSNKSNAILRKGKGGNVKMFHFKNERKEKKQSLMA